jgi:hypothetical protein
MTPRGFGDLRQRLRALPGRVWCAVFHRRLWKVWRPIDTRHGPTAVSYRCRVCGRQFIRSQRDSSTGGGS